ncbi:MAG: glycosyltransferase [Candidatus Gracilibacteria bacterium]|nr:glycosyltransferase [Candidatus Gracilibacteria bacterium]
MPKISIITTTYRHEKFIAQTIDSILTQTFSNWELLIGDDSPDNATWDIIQEYTQKDSRIKAWHHTPNKGIIDNMNFLLSQVSSESEYVAFLEGDDIYLPENLEKKLKIFEQYPGLALVYNNLDFIDAEGKIFHRNFLAKAPFYLKNQKLTKEQFIKHETFYGSYSTLMIRKDVLETEKIVNITDDKLYSVSDWDLFFRISTKYPIYGIDDSMTLYRRHIGNVSSQYIKLFNDLEIQINEYLKIGFIDQRLFDLKLSFIDLLKSVAHLEKIEKKESLLFLFKSFKLSPLSNPIYKIGILVMNLLPAFLIKKMLKIIIKRGE